MEVKNINGRQSLREMEGEEMVVVSFWKEEEGNEANLTKLKCSIIGRGPSFQQRVQTCGSSLH